LTLKGKNYCITGDNICSHELIGLGVRVIESTDAERIGLGGKVVDETRNLLVIEKDGKEKMVPKGECVFEFMIGDEKARVEGKKIVARPEQRVKRGK